MIYNDFIEHGYRVFGLHSVRDGTCGCGDPACSAAGKHPIASNWQHTPLWSDEQVEVMELSGQFDTGYGVLVTGLLVVDVDARNGGVESYQRLVELIPEIAGAGLIVETGSGGGSKHLYFALHESVALTQHHSDCPGIDFKSSGFVVGPGSLHASGRRYDVLVGSVSDIAPAPQKLLDMLRKPDRHRVVSGGRPIDVTAQDIAAMLAAIDPDCDHETWYRAGMAVHEATGGTGFALWNDWSARGAKYPGHDVLERRWHSFGKSTNPVTIGTLIHYAEQAGWRMPVEFTDDTNWLPDQSNTLDTGSVDLLRPPGLVGRLAEWINAQSIYPREHLAVAAALMAVSNIAGMRYHDPLDNTSFNLFCFGVADSSSGKEAILQAHNEILRSVGLAAAVHGGIKSEQEIYRNLVRHQAAYYSIDELGEVLGKIINARSKGSASYLEGVVGALMSLYSKSNSFAAITGDLKEEVRNSLNTERQRLEKQIEENEDKSGRLARRVERLEKALASIDMGLENPFLSIFGLTTPERFNDLMTPDMTANGFLGRALVFREPVRNPKIKPRNQRARTPLPDQIVMALRNLYSPGEYDMLADHRVERVGDKYPLQTTGDAERLLDQIAERFWQIAEEHRDVTGLHPIPRRGYELVAKISATLAIPSGLRTAEHVTWAYALVLRDVSDKLRLAHSNAAEGTSDGLGSRILAFLGGSDGETMRAIKRACRKYAPADVETTVKRLVEAGAVTASERSTGSAGRPIVCYAAAGCISGH